MKTLLVSSQSSFARPAIRSTGIGARRSARGNSLKLVTLLLALLGAGAA